MKGLKEAILEQGRAQMEYYRLLNDLTETVTLPVSEIWLSGDVKAQVQLRIVTKEEDFIDSPEYEIKL